ncbi:MAG TPA: dephospho-CoA kinase [Candidatus Omnitrophota bacterium]|nr:dephospho-CoA kinase [Candidatus Omnitrophota bacterium]HPD85032.1 dephospho-CoA kinase [Candidatus Omnitrophota bacterium]HRZ03890.1 dephospho-CoA kinase [Candidatus Omnitrophota bacterium]
MLVVGLTGSLATGKSTVAEMFRRLGGKVIDADDLNRKLLERGGGCVKPVLKVFGPGIFTKGRIDRRKLSAIVFNDSRKLKKLCDIIHPIVIRQTKQTITHYRKSQNKSIVVIIDAPLLIEAGLGIIVDFLVVVKANRRQQLARTVKRTGIARGEALKRIKAQMPLAEKIRMADAVIDNRGSLTRTKEQVKVLWQRLLRIKK